MSKGIPLNVLWDALDEKHKFIARDGDRGSGEGWCAYTLRPVKSEHSRVWICVDGDDPYEITLPIDAMHDVPWGQTIIERPIPIQVGAFGKFWDADTEPRDEEATWGYLMNVAEDGTYEDARAWWVHFIPKMPVPLMKMGEKKDA